MSEGRFQHLLQPIRDLTKNWNIDLATELEEYMDKLETLSISFDPDDGARLTGNHEGANVMNFAEAALLIQGTSVIYSRKVEYLHALVYQTLAHLCQQQEEGLQRHADGEMRASEMAKGEQDGTLSVAFHPLPLYDTLQEAKATQITLKRSQATEEMELGRNTLHTEATALTQRKNNIQASVALLESLVPNEREHGETFKLLSCNLHVSGVLLLDEASKKYLQPAPGQVAWDPSRAFNETPGRPRDSVAEEGRAIPPLHFNDYDAPDHDNDLEAHFDNHSDYEADATTDLPLDAMAIETMPRLATTETWRGPKGPENDPWNPLDAYDASASVVRPFRKGRSYPRIPAYKKTNGLLTRSNQDGVVQENKDHDGLSDRGFQNRFFIHSKMPQWASWIWTETASENPLEKTCKRTFCKRKLLVKTCVALWQREAKWRRSMRRVEAREKQSAHAMLLREQDREDEESDTNNPLTLSAATSRLDVAFQTDDATTDRRDNSDDYDNNFEGAEWDSCNESGADFGPNATDSGEVGTYEDICRQHLATFMSGTEKYVRETDLSKKVAEWQDKLGPLLKQQDARPPFDIHQCGREILCHLEREQGAKPPTKKRKKKRARADDENDAVAFKTLVDGKSPFEVCRLFLASLQLANSGNVALTHAHVAAEHESVPFAMQLLRTTSAYESLQV